MKGEKRNVYVIVGIVIILAVFAAWFGERKEGEFIAYEDYNDFLETVSTNPLIAEKQIEDYTNNLIEAYTNDTYGGETPEETLQLFIDALKNGDTDLAAKYFVVEKQGRALVDLNIANQNGFLEQYISILNEEKQGTMYGNNIRYEINFFNEKKEQIHVEVLVLNLQTNKWKMYEL